MVLQREQPIRIIGKAQPNSQVTVRLGEQTALAKTDGTGRWEQTFTPRTANSQPTTLTVQEAGRPDVSVRDILMVLLCSLRFVFVFCAFLSVQT
jgi:sialate O-acetylesterase